MTAELVELHLPTSVVGRSDIFRLQKELVTVDTFLRQAAVRQPGTSMKLPRTSRLFDDLIMLNKLNMLQEADRQKLKIYLESVYEQAPRLHMSFSTDPSAIFLQKLITWLRQNIHPQVMLQTGLQPGMGAGCTIRTDNKYFDFSLRQKFTDKRSLLISRFEPKSDEVAKGNPTA